MKHRDQKAYAIVSKRSGKIQFSLDFYSHALIFNKKQIAKRLSQHGEKVVRCKIVLLKK